MSGFIIDHDCFVDLSVMSLDHPFSSTILDTCYLFFPL